MYKMSSNKGNNDSTSDTSVQDICDAMSLTTIDQLSPDDWLKQIVRDKLSEDISSRTSHQERSKEQQPFQDLLDILSFIFNSSHAQVLKYRLGRNRESDNQVNLPKKYEIKALMQLKGPSFLARLWLKRALSGSCVIIYSQKKTYFKLTRLSKKRSNLPNT